MVGCAGREASAESDDQAAPPSDILPDGIPQPESESPPEAPRPPLLSRIWDTLVFWDNQNRDKPPRASLPLWIGTVRLVNDRSGFVLIENTSAFGVPPGQKLIVVVPGREDAELEVSRDREHPFFIADIVSGAPRVSDRVYSPQ